MKKWIMITVGILFLSVLVIVIWEWIYFKRTTEQEVYILPQGFKGIVLVAYNQPDGIEEIKADGQLIYKIPPSGVLRLKQQAPSKLSQSRYYFENEQGKWTEFYYCFPPCEEMKRNPSNVYAYGTSTGSSIGDNGYELKRTIFLVGTSRDIDSLNKSAEKLNPIDLLNNSK